MKKNILIIIGILFVFGAKSQTNNQYDTINFEAVGCIKYKYKTISIDDDENNSLFYSHGVGGSYINFTDLLIKSIKEYGVTAFTTSNFKVPLILSEALHQMGEHTDTLFYIGENEELLKKVEKTKYNIDDIIAFNIKELCIYDKSNILINSKIEAICPVRKYWHEDGEGINYRSTFWIYFDELSDILKKYNTADDETYFDFFYNKEYKTSFNENFNYYQQKEVFVNPQKFEKNYDHIFKYSEQPKVCPVSHFSEIETKDIMYAEYKYRILDTLNEENRPLFFPKSADDESESFNSLIDVFMYAIKNEGLTVYEPELSFARGINIFNQPAKLKDVEEKLGKSIEELHVWDEEYYETYGENKIYYIKTPCDLDAVNNYVIQELWLYNYDNQPIDVKTVGIAPVRTFFRPDDIDEENPLRKIVFWAYYPQFQNIASQYNAYTADCQNSKTFDQIVFNQDYKSEIYSYRIEEEYKLDTFIFDTIPCIVNLEDNKPFYENLGIVFSENEINTENKKQKKAKYTKTVYTKIEKNDENKEIFYPKKPAYGYKSFIDHIMNSFNNKKIYLYESENLEKTITAEKAKEILGEKIGKYIDYDEYGNEQEIEITYQYKSSEITSYLTKEIWHYKGKKIVKKEIVAICPVREYYRDSDPDCLEPLYKKMFWIDFKELEKSLKNTNITKISGIPDQTIPSYFNERNYKSKIIENGK